MALPDFLFDVVNGPTLTLLSGSASASVYMTERGTIGFGDPGDPSVDMASLSISAHTSSYVTGGLSIIGTLTASFIDAGVISASSIHTTTFNATVTTMSVGFLTVTQVIEGTAKSASYVPSGAVDVFATNQPGTGVGGLIFSEHFMAPTTALISNLAIATNGTAAAGTLVSGSVGHPGIFNLSTGTATTGRVSLYSFATAILFGGGTYSIETMVNIPVLSVVAQRYTLYFGFGDNTAAGDQVDGAYFQYNDSASTFWQIKTSNNSVRTTTTTTTSVVTGWTKLRVSVVGTTRADFYINDVLVGSIATNIPSTTLRGTSVILKVEKSLGTTRANIQSDYIKLAFN